jgi:GT2 family glycosyltransferase
MGAMTPEEQTCIVLLNWNGWRDTIACLESLLPSVDRGARIVVCDNASSDGSLERIEAWARGELPAPRSGQARLDRLQSHDLPRPAYTRIDRKTAERGAADPRAGLILVDNGANLGFAAGNNVGLRFALAQEDMTHVWLLNNDTLVEADCLAVMHERLAGHDRPSVCGSMIHFFDEPGRIQCIGGNRFDHRRGVAHTSEGRYLHEDRVADVTATEACIDYLSGCSMLLPRAFLETVGLMNEAYFLYYEEIDWFTRAEGRFDLLIAAGARLYHREGGSIGSRSWRRGPSLVADLHMFRSRLRYMRAYQPRYLWRCVLNNALDVGKRLARGQWRNALVIAGVHLRDRGPRGTAT